MTTFNSIKDLDKQLDYVGKIALNQVASSIILAWKNYISTLFYQQYSPSKYKRQYNLINSLVKTKIKKDKGVWVIDIYMDNTINTNYEIYNEAAENGMSKDQANQYVYNLAEQGIHGNPGIQAGGGFYEAILQDVSSGKFYDEFGEILKSMGFNWTK